MATSEHCSSAPPQLQDVLQLVLPFLPRYDEADLRLVSKRLQLAYDSFQPELTLRLDALTRENEPATGPAALARLIERGRQLPRKLTLNYFVHTIDYRRDNDADADDAGRVGDSTWAEAMAAVGQRATSLTLKGHPPQTADAIASLAAAAPAVTELEADLWHMPPAVVSALLSSFGPQLEVLDLDVGGADWLRQDDKLDEALSMLTCCSQLQRLSFACSTSSCRLPLEWFTSLTKLHTLELESVLLAPGQSDLSGLSRLVGLTRLKLREVQPRGSSGVGLWPEGEAMHHKRRHRYPWELFPLAPLESLSSLKLQSLELQQERFALGPAPLMSLSSLTHLTQLKLDLYVEPYMLSALTGALKPLGNLRELLLPNAEPDYAWLSALHDKPLQVLQVSGRLRPPPPADNDFTAADGACFPAAMQELRLTKYNFDPMPISLLAALPPVPQGLARIDLCQIGGTVWLCVLLRDRTDEEEQAPVAPLPQPVPPAVAGHMRAAAALLAGRMWVVLRKHDYDEARRQVLDKLHLWAFERDPYDRDEYGVWRGLPGPHAPWLRELAPLAGEMRKVALVDMELCSGDLAALVAAAPSLQGLSLDCCSWPAAALLELAPLERLSKLHLELAPISCGGRLLSPAAMATLPELVMRAPALKKMILDVPVDGVQLLQVAGAADGGLWPEAEEAASDADGGSGSGTWRTCVYAYMLDALVATLQMRGWPSAADTKLLTSKGRLDQDMWCWALTVDRAVGAGPR